MRDALEILGFCLAIILVVNRFLRWTKCYRSTAAVASTVLRLGAYIHIRWIMSRAWPTAFLAYALYFVCWQVEQAKLDQLERLGGKENGGVFGRATERLNEWRKVDGDGTVSSDRENETEAAQEAEDGDGSAPTQESTPDEALDQANVVSTATEGKLASSEVPVEGPSTAPGAPSYAAVTAGAVQPIKDESSEPGHSPTSDAPAPPTALHASSSLRAPHLSHAAQAIDPARSHPITALFGWVTRSRVTNRLSLLVNTLLIIAVLDSVFRPHLFNGAEDLAFSRVGAVGETWVHLHARIPPVVEISAAPSMVTKRVKMAVGIGDADEYRDVVEEVFAHAVEGASVLYRQTRPLGKWWKGPDLIGSNFTDWTATARIDGLFPSTEYEYRLTKRGIEGVGHPSFPEVGYFRTFPDSRIAATPGGGSTFTFGAASCMTPGFPYNPFDSVLSNHGAEYLLKHIREEALEFFVFLGDFIYIDVPFFNRAGGVSAYFRKYRQMYANPAWKKFTKLVPTLHIYDDHEIANDYSGHTTGGERVFAPANQAYRSYHGQANYPGPGHGSNYYWFRHGDAAFFVWDTRRYRSPNKALDDRNKTMLGADQKAIFTEWLSAVNHTVTFKFVVSSVPFVSLWDGQFAKADDTWAGFMTERAELLDVMEHVPNLLVLSGDRHEFAAAMIRDKILEVSTSPLNQFYLPLKTYQPNNSAGSTGEDKSLAYIPEGNHKFTTVTVDTRVDDSPKLMLKMWSNGELAWNLTYVAHPVREPPVQIGSLIPTLAEWLGLKPPKWLKPFRLQTQEDEV